MSNIFSNLDPFPFYQYSFSITTYQIANYYDNDYLYEYTRITNSICIDGFKINSDIVDKSVNICNRINTDNPSLRLEAVIGVNFSPWHRRWIEYETFHSVTLDPWDRTSIYDVGDFDGIYDGLTVFEAELQYFQDLLETIMEWLADANEKYNADVRIGALLLDTEHFRLSGHNEEYWNGAKECYDAIQIRLISTLQGNPSGSEYEMEGVDIIWYIKGLEWNNWSNPPDWDNPPDPEDMIFFDNGNFTGQELISLASFMSYYTNYDGVFDAYMGVMNEYVTIPSVNTHIYPNKIVPWFTLCAGYQLIPDVEAKVWSNYIDYHTIYSYKIGRKMNRDGDLYRFLYATVQYPAPFDADYDELSKYPGPSALQYEVTWIDHFIEYAKGVNDVDNNIVALYTGSSVSINSSIINYFRFYIEKGSDEAIISIEGVNYVVGEQNSSLVWDKNGENYVFSFVGESINRDVGNEQVVITYAGTGSYAVGSKITVLGRH